MRMARLISFALWSCALAETLSGDEVDHYNYLAGTQAIGGRYQFSSDSRLVESAKQIEALGSNVLKFTLSNEGSFGAEHGNVPSRPEGIETLTDLVTKEPSHRAVLGMPFTYYLIWAYPLGCRTQAGRFEHAEAERQYREMYDLTVHLLKTYSGTGKQFYLGHWEGDWHLRPSYDPKQPVGEETLKRFTEWLQIRQHAVDDAKRDTLSHRVAVWNYTEVNLVRRFMESGGECLTNSVLPEVDVDFVSYSSYDALGNGIRAELLKSLDYIQSKLRPKPGISGKRVFIGEFGFPARTNTPEQQNQRTVQTLMAGIEWGCPFTLYWQLYDNERRGEEYAGFWMIDQQGAKQPVWHTFERYFAWARRYVGAEVERKGSPPSDSEFRQAALHYLRECQTKP